jgi:hypothetical protein
MVRLGEGVNMNGSQAGGAPQPESGVDGVFLYCILMLVVVIGGLVLLAKYFGGKEGALTAAAATSKAVAAFSPWFPVR